MTWRAVLMAVLAGTLGGCAGQTGGRAGQTSAAPARVGRSGANIVHHRGGRRTRRRIVRGRPGVAGLAFSRASNNAVQPQPPPDSCHAVGQGVLTRPDPRCTPGALNPEVRQSDIGQTICVTGWTATVRPPEAVTEPEKHASLAAYGDVGPLSDYEYDHLVPLELGGATNDPRNLWPEPGPSPNRKDAVELDLRDRVCGGQMTLAQARREIARDWIKLGGREPPGGDGSSDGAAGETCSVHAVFNSEHGDYDVYVSSNQPEQTVTVTGNGHSRTWHTSAAGTADVYFPGGRGATGQRIGVRVGGARCAGAL